MIIKLLFKLHLMLLITIITYNCNIIFQNAHAENFSNKNKSNIRQHINQLHHIYDAHSECLIQIQQQLSENKQNINILRGYIQDVQHYLSKLDNDQKELYKKLSDMINTHNNNCINNESHQLSIISTPTTPIITNTNSNISHNMISHDQAYKQTVSLVLEKKQYDQAIQAFQNFIKNYPHSHYQANAHYWLGQLYYNKNKKDKASYYFALVTKKYPKSIKAPDALLKIGIIMQETHQIEKAKMIYQQISKLYPSSNAAKQAQKQLTHF